MGILTQGFVKTYDPKRVVVTFINTTISGFADGTFIEVRSPSPRWTKYVGSDGEVGRSKSNDTTKEVVIHLSQTSLSNSFLSTMLVLDVATNNGIGPLKIADLNGGAELFFAQAWIRMPPDVTYDKVIGPRVWTFDTGQIINEAYNADYVSLSQ